MTHQWRAVIVFRLDPETAEKLYSGPPGPPVDWVSAKADVTDGRAILSADLVDQELSSVGCAICEQAYLTSKDTPCPGEPIGYTKLGEPLYDIQAGT